MSPGPSTRARFWRSMLLALPLAWAAICALAYWQFAQ